MNAIVWRGPYCWGDELEAVVAAEEWSDFRVDELLQRPELLAPLRLGGRVRWPLN